MAAKKRSKKKLTKKLNNDAYYNQRSGIGTARDKTADTRAVAVRLTWGELEEVFESDPMARRICELFPYYALRKKPTFTSDETSTVEFLKQEEKRLDLVAKTRIGWVWARTYGGSALIIGAAGHPSTPLPPNAEIKFLRVLDQTQVTSTGEMDRDFTSENWGEPRYYNVTPINGHPMIMHHSRVVRIHGDELPRRRYIGNNYWGTSVLNALHNALKKYATVQDAIANLVVDYRQTVYTYSNLEEILAAGGHDDIIKRAETMDAVRSILNATMLSENEKMEIIGGGQTAGLPELADKAIMRLSTETGVPHTVLLGDSPSGLGATGESERLDFNNLVESQRDAKPVPAMTTIFNQCLRAKGKKADSFEMIWPNLWSSTPKDEVASRSTQADTDQKYIDMGVPAEVILRSRFGGEGGYSYETQVPDEILDTIEVPEVDPEILREDHKEYFKQKARGN